MTTSDPEDEQRVLGDPVAPHPDPRRELALLIGAARRQVARARRRGNRRTEAGPALVPTPPRARPVAAASVAASPPGERTAPAPGPSSGPSSAELTEVARRAAEATDWEALRRTVADCQACSLSRTRTRTVFADGSPTARVLFVGEAPGFHEDQQGVPFVGKAGALLTDIIQKGMGLARSEVAIANTLKCRPPENRDPTPAEKETCTPYLLRQIELVDPELIVALGRHAAGYLLRSEASLGQLRGRIHRPDHLGGRRVLATYHPAFLLRSPHMKKETWQDIQLGMAELGLPLPGRR